MKVTKKLVAAIVCFVFSVALCVFACYAWFTSNSSVNAGGIATEVDGSKADIAVKAYFLSESRNASDGSTTYTVTKRHIKDVSGDGILNGSEEMLKYNTDPLSATALLLEVDCYSATLGNYYISVATPTVVFDAVKSGASGDASLYNGYLSNVVHFNSVTAAPNPEGELSCKLGIGVAQYSLVNGTQVINDNPVTVFTFTDGDEKENGYYKQTHYLIMDYDNGHMSDLYDKISLNDASLKEIAFASDVIIKLTEGNTELQADPDNSVQKVIDLISAIGTVTEDSGAKIATARNAFNSLSADQQNAVTNKDVLFAAEAAFEQFALDDFNAKFAAVDALEAEASSAYEAALSAAETAYGLLSDAQKEEVAASYASLVAKRAEYENLLQAARDKAAADAAVAKIDAIGTVTLSSADAISAAREAYENLIAAQKAYVPAAKLTTLTDAETEYERLRTMVTGVSLDKTTETLNKGDTVTLTATITPQDAANKTVSWTSSAPTVATVDGNGKVTAVGGGSATITVTTEDGGFTATCAVTVKVPVTGVTLDNTTATLSVGDTLPLTATINPADATNPSVSWKSSDTSVATVDNTGKVTAKAAGTATITVTTADGNKTATCAITVTSGGGGSNILDTSKNYSNGAVYGDDTTDIKVALSGGGVTSTAINATSSDGKQFSSYLLAGGNGRTYSITANKKVKVVVYYTVCSSSNGAVTSSPTVTATVNSTELSKSSETSRTSGTAYKLEFELNAGEVCTVASSANRLCLFGIFIENL